MSVSLDSSKGIEEKPTPIIQRVSPRTITGILSPANKGAIDWGWQSFVAFGCHNHVVIVDTQNVKVFQTLEKHTSDVVKVKWACENYYHDLENPYRLRLASLDTSGLIIIWDVKEGKTISSFFEPGKPAIDIEWLSFRDSCQNLLLGLHPPYSIVLWNTENGTKVWKKSYTETLLSFAFDPFTECNITFLASDCILFVNDFNVQKSPSSNGRKFYVSNPSTEEKGNKTRSGITRRIWLLAKTDIKPTEEGVTLNECLNLAYHKSYRHHLLLLYPKEILILDLEINQTVGIVSCEGSSMAQLYSCWQRDVFYILHESGGVSFRLRHRGHSLRLATPSEGPDADVNLDVMYNLQCQSDSLRLTKHARVTGMSVCPLTESKMALLVSDGRLLFMEASTMHKKENLGSLPPYLLDQKLLALKESENTQHDSKTVKVPILSNSRHPAATLADNLPPAVYQMDPVPKPIRFRLWVVGHLGALAGPPHVLRMCPPVTYRNWSFYKPLLAVGNSSGSVQIINMALGLIEKEYSLHTSPVRGIEWIGLTSFLSYSHPNTTNSSGYVRNELVLTDLQSGRTKSLRGDRGEESPIDMIRVSYLRRYVIIAFKEEPFEIWDLRQLILLRVMPKNFPAVTALEWSPGHYKKTQSSTDLGFEKAKSPSTSCAENPSEADSTPKSVSYTKEHLVFTDMNGQLYHFSVEGNTVKHGTVIPAEQAMGSVTCIAWKGDNIVLGDVDGNLTIWNLKSKVSKGISTNRGWIRKIRFGPGKGNMKILVLYNDGVDVWDAKEVEFLNQVRCPRELPKVQDLDWVGSDRPVLATADGCLRVTDITLKTYASPLNDYQVLDFPFCPHVLSGPVSLCLRSFMQHSISAADKFAADIDQLDDLNMSWGEEQLRNLDSDLREFLRKCPFGTAERALHIARLFGDQEACQFWTLALHFLKRKKYHQLLEEQKSEKKGDEHPKPEVFFDQPLDTRNDFFCESEVYKQLQLDRVKLHLSKRTTHTQTQQCAERLLLLGQTEEAVQLLLETEADNETFYQDCLRACLMSTVGSCEPSQSIVKLVSTNLIASGRISEGVQLLCLIGKATDACRYLQGAGRWDDAIWLAKATLPSTESHEVLRRWVEHLRSTQMDQKNRAILVLLSMGEIWKVVEWLHSHHRADRAALLLEAAFEFGLITRTQENAKTVDAVFLDYSRHLLSIKNRNAAIHYCQLGEELAKE